MRDRKWKIIGRIKKRKTGDKVLKRQAKEEMWTDRTEANYRGKGTEKVEVKEGETDS